MSERVKYVFGPVPSRRLGQSLGIDTIPFKTCNWNCVYCQLGRTRPLVSERKNYYVPRAIVEEVARALDQHQPGEIDWITFVGSGEPLLHAGMGWMIRKVRRLTNLPVAVITNGALLSIPKVRDEISPADAVLPSLDAGTQALHRRINRPHPSVSFDDHVEGLAAFRREFSGKLWAETMLVRGLNDGDEALKNIASALQRIDPDEVDINVPTRVPAEKWVKEPGEGAITRAMTMLGGIARAILPAPGGLDLSGFDNVVDAVASVVSRHPMREEELRRALASCQDADAETVLVELEASKRVHVVERHGTRYWCSAQAYYPREQEKTRQ